MQIENQVFIVTGGASGLGAGTARMIRRAGGKVVIADRDALKGEALAKELNQTFVQCDVSSESDGMAVVAAAEAVGPVRGLINCAGIAGPERILGKNGPHGLESFRKIVTVNLIGTFNMTRLAAEAMSRNEPTASGERGIIVSTASVAAYDGQIGQAAYAASKAGIAGLTLPMARDLARSAIRCMTIAPGIFATPLLMELSEEVRQSLAASVPFPSRLGTAEDFASLVQQIIINEMLNGEVIRLDGAIRMAPK
ncbi:SDR family NAD(P)-dependent oxidoreductase [Herbaspirillum sp. alder98]|uniref:SDR family NAD(P)-dependent oxidoreductase n=1 Tax=Herbaspirillum sp. alder98 TaxID=2913096 RepID=UPI001CD8E58D|nr:SDR family NAD(P)-dependent oxidoreductase [Herbaspirillum sp. alder98]MCA1326070.1 SDR family NAD(P)-dependent oxidoreductase [Herbaspirillum sp. alder98]